MFNVVTSFKYYVSGGQFTSPKRHYSACVGQCHEYMSVYGYALSPDLLP